MLKSISIVIYLDNAYKRAKLRSLLLFAVRILCFELLLLMTAMLVVVNFWNYCRGFPVSEDEADFVFFVFVRVVFCLRCSNYRLFDMCDTVDPR